MKSRVAAKHPNAWLFTAMFAISDCCCSTSRTNLTFDFAMQQPKCHYVWALTGRPSRYYCYPLSFVFPSISIFNFSLIAHESSSILAAPLYDVYPVTDSHWCVSQSVWLAVFSHVREYMRWFVCVYRAVQCTLCCACAALLPNAIRRVDGSLCCHQPPPQTHTGTHALMVLHCWSIRLDMHANRMDVSVSVLAFRYMREKSIRSHCAWIMVAECDAYTVL